MGFLHWGPTVGALRAAARYQFDAIKGNPIIRTPMKYDVAGRQTYRRKPCLGLGRNVSSTIAHITGAIPYKRIARGTALPLLIALVTASAHVAVAETSQAEAGASPSRTDAAPPQSASSAASDACTELGAAARAVAAWRDAGGAAWIAKAKLDQRIPERPVREAAQQLVDTLYTPTMRKLNPDDIGLAVANSCMDAKPLPPVKPPAKQAN
jgi:hypothetical protein